MTSGCGTRQIPEHPPVRSVILAPMRPFRIVSLLTLLAACGGPAPGPDAGADSGPLLTDAASTPTDAGDPSSDAGADAGSATDPDAGSAPPAGVIEGACGVLDEELTDTSMPFYVENAMTFDEPWSSADADRVSEGAREILMDGTAGGSSGYSEAFAFEVLHRCEGAELIKSETEIEYDVEGSPKTDILVRIDDLPIGVSVTRAVTVVAACTRADTYPMDRATTLLTEKLEGIAASSANVSEADSWVKQILFVWADTEAHAETVRSVWEGLDTTLRADVVLFVSVSEGMDAFIYHEDRCS